MTELEKTRKALRTILEKLETVDGEDPYIASALAGFRKETARAFATLDDMIWLHSPLTEEEKEIFHSEIELCLACGGKGVLRYLRLIPTQCQECLGSGYKGVYPW